MDFIVKLASGFMNLFTLGGTQFVSWVTGIIPTIVILLILMNAIIALVGDEKIEKIARICTGNPILRYMVLPFVSRFMLGNPMDFQSVNLCRNSISLVIMRQLPTTVIPIMVFSHISMLLSCLSGSALQMEYRRWDLAPYRLQSAIC